MIIDNVEDTLYFDSIRNYTLALLGSFDKIQHYVKKEIDGELAALKKKVKCRAREA